MTRGREDLHGDRLRVRRPARLAAHPRPLRRRRRRAGDARRWKNSAAAAPPLADYATLIDEGVVHVIADESGVQGAVVCFPKDGHFFLENEEL